MKTAIKNSSAFDSSSKKRPTRADTMRQPLTDAQASPCHPVILQRTSTCACGGRCPRCTAVIQPKLTMGQPNDKYEQEADRAADQVMAMPDPTVQRQVEEDEEEEPIQTKLISDQITPLVQRQTEPDKEELQAKEQTGHTPQVVPNAAASIQSLRGGGQPLSDSERTYFEPRFGQDFSHVRIHSDSSAAQMAKAMRAKAFTLGNDMVFGQGLYAPGTSNGRKLLAHELTHTVQQSAGGLRLQCAGDRDDPNRYATVHQNLFTATQGGSGSQPWINPDPSHGVAGTSVDILRQARTALDAEHSQHPTTFTQPPASGTSESVADSSAIAVDARIRAQFSQITRARTASAIRNSVTVFGRAFVTSDPTFLQEWMANKLIELTDIENFNISESDPRFQAIVNDLLTDSTWRPRLINWASRGAGFLDRRGASPIIRVNRGAGTVMRNATLIHELTHLYADPAFKDWVATTNSVREYDEGITEYLAQQVMNGAELSASTPVYASRVASVQSNILRYVSNDDIARAYFQGEVWRIEDRSSISQREFAQDTGIQHGASRSDEMTQSTSGPGIVQIVDESRHYRFMNLGINQSALKPEHISRLRALLNQYIRGHADVSIRFIGHTSSPGSTQHNDTLSISRAAAFYAFSQAEGIPNSQLLDLVSPPHLGESSPTAEDTDVHGRAFNRRVEVFIV